MERMLLVLKRSADQEADLRKLLDDQQNAGSPSYHKWLTPDQFGQRFGPSDPDIQAVTDWLKSQGFRVDHVYRGRSLIEFSGTAAQVENTLGTAIHKFVVNNQTHWANATDQQIPVALSPVVAGVLSLHDFYKKPQFHLLEDRFSAHSVRETKPQFNSSTGVHALGPADYYTIYNFNPLHIMTSAKIAIVGRTNINVQDVTYFHCWMYDQAESPQVIVNGPDPGDLGGADETEAVLDTTWAGAVAPTAGVYLVVFAIYLYYGRRRPVRSLHHRQQRLRCDDRKFFRL
jgi:subtilase family serine protease